VLKKKKKGFAKKKKNCFFSKKSLWGEKHEGGPNEGKNHFGGKKREKLNRWKMCYWGGKTASKGKPLGKNCGGGGGGGGLGVWGFFKKKKKKKKK